jgi:hypothetical protein
VGSVKLATVRPCHVRSNTRGWLLAALLASALGCSTSNTGDDASADAGPISDPAAFCKSSKTIECERAYECVPAGARDAEFMSSYGASVSDCKSMVDTICADPATSCPNFDAASAGSCVAGLTGETCMDLVFVNLIAPPNSCLSACGM